MRSTPLTRGQVPESGGGYVRFRYINRSSILHWNHTAVGRIAWSESQLGDADDGETIAATRVLQTRFMGKLVYEAR